MNNFLVTCEHASNKFPAEYKNLFRGRGVLLSTHRGWDKGALPLTQNLAKALRSPLIAGKFSRLLVDLNRTEDNHGVFSKITRALPAKERERLLARFHRPHWKKARFLVRRKPVIHLGIHSFTPVMRGYRRPTAIGLLYDPARPQEDEFCRRLQKILKKSLGVAVHRNLPYRGTGNGLIAALRKENKTGYIGVEIELNGRLAKNAAFVNKLSPILARAIREAQS